MRDHFGEYSGDMHESAMQRESWRMPGPHTGKGPKNYRRPDGYIREDIYERLTHFGQFDELDMNVDVQDGIVTISGTVQDRATKRLAGQIADSVYGVKDVCNMLQIEGMQQYYKQATTQSTGNQPYLASHDIGNEVF